jgi:hypothetical protein
VEKGVRLGLALEVFAADGLLTLLWQMSLECQLDALADRLLTGVGQHGVTRLVIDGLDSSSLPPSLRGWTAF